MTLEQYPPTLLQRLIDHEPSSLVDRYRPPSKHQLRDIIISEINLLLQHDNDNESFPLSKYYYVAGSVINYGIPPNYGFGLCRKDILNEINNDDRNELIIKNIKIALLRFEPRIIPASLRVGFDEDWQFNDKQPGVLVINISGLIYWQPTPIELAFKTRLNINEKSNAFLDDDVIV